MGQVFPFQYLSQCTINKYMMKILMMVTGKLFEVIFILPSPSQLFNIFLLNEKRLQLIKK